ncbi:MAG TPA: GMC family oxidoreductase [Solirubrobacterales bacterium]|nr:GMC family oxidoreductase [Solirubrobacterales bacterium]
MDLALSRYDVVVVGAGAAGGWAAKELSERGLEVALLDAGPLFPVADEGGLERRPVQSDCYACTEESAHLFVDDFDNPFQTAEGTSYRWIRARQMGGRLHVWGRTSPRMRDDEFKAASADGVGQDWPISAADLAPAYSRVEEFLDVKAAPLVSAERKLKEAIEARWPSRGVEETVWACREPGRMLQAALRTGRVALFAETIAERVLVAPGGDRARGVAFVDRRTGSRHEIEGRAVVLCASALESTRLLLNSATADHPDGLANSSGVLGRYLMDHTYGIYYEGLAPPRGEEEYEPRSQGAFMPGFRNLTEEAAGFLRSYAIELQVMTRPKPAGRLRRGVRDDFWMSAFGEVLPNRDNGVELDSSHTDEWGIPTLRVDARYGENERAMARDQLQTMREMLEAGGFEITASGTELSPPGLSAHELGTARMGDDPETSVLDAHNRAWEVPNLLVTDAASFASSGHRNPTLTIMALTVRACERLADELSAG